MLSSLFKEQLSSLFPYLSGCQFKYNLTIVFEQTAGEETHVCFSCEAEVSVFC